MCGPSTLKLVLFYFTHQDRVKSSERPPLVADGSGCRDAQLDMRWRGLHGSLSLELRRMWPTQFTKRDSHGLSDTEAVSTGPAWVCTSPLHTMAVSFVLCGSPNSGNRCVFDSFCLLFSSCWVALARLNMRGFALSYCILFCSAWFLPLEGPTPF